MRSTLGVGAMGVVYRAFDRQLGLDVAVKKLRHVTGRGLYRFKREFRALAGIVHPNLVTLYELHTSGDEWLVTMELVEGVSFIDWVRHEPAGAALAASPAASSTGLGATPDADPTRGRARGRREILRAPLDLERLEAALPQLVDGVHALHLYGMLHRDLKPSNVLVTASGRVVVLDFGLVADLRGGSDHTHELSAIGTPPYMSPEQAADEPLTEASDWYAVGAMLYEALTGVRPFEGDSDEVLRRKQDDAPPPAPHALCPGVPGRLDALCERLLARRPADRPEGRAILAALGRAPSPATAQLAELQAARPFVDRAGEMEALRRARQDARSHPVAVFVAGEAGIGKSRLARCFLDEVAAGPAPSLVLETRCYERESVPLKALDGLIDAIAGALIRLPDERVASDMPDIGALVRLFPVLARVPAVADRAPSAVPPEQPPELRRRVARQLRQLLAWLGTLQPVAIAIDDLHWGDIDSARFFSELVHHPDAPPLLLLLLHRIEEDGGAVAAVRQPHPSLAAGDVRTIFVGALADPEARDLARSFGGSEEAVESLVRETAGHPLFLIELGRTASRGSEPAPSFDQLIAGRTAALPPSAAALLRTIAVAARPMPLLEAAAAAGLAGVGPELSLLVAAHLVRLRHFEADDVTHVEPYHDRVREAVVGALDDTSLRHIHEALSRAFELAGRDGALDTLAAHWLGAGDPARAAQYAAQAASVASSALAFHRAAELYALALAHGGGDVGERRQLHRGRAEALANAGRLDEAAAAYAEAARGAPPDEALELDRCRLEQLLRRGHVAEGMALARALFERVGIVLPAGRAVALQEVIDIRQRLRLRGRAFVERSEAEVPAELLRRIDLLTTVSIAISVGDPLLGSLVQGHLLEAALDSGEPHRICVALATELGYLSATLPAGHPRLEEIRAEVEAMATGIDDPYVTGLSTAMLGLAAFEAGQWQVARDRLESGIQRLCACGRGVRWELDVAEHFRLGALSYLGETHELTRQVPGLLRDAIERGDLYAEQALRAWRPNLTWLIQGQPDDARRQVVAVEAASPVADELQLRHFYLLSSLANIDLYEGESDRAWQRVDGTWQTLVSSHLLRIPLIRIEATFLHARAALARAPGAVVGERRELEALARTLAEQLGREPVPWARALGLMTEGMVAAVGGDRDSAVARLSAAADAFTSCDMWLHASVARLRASELDGDEAAAASTRAAMRAEAIADPDAIARMLCPLP